MPNAANLTPDSRFLGLFIGKSGSGKTVAECSFPGRKKVFDFDGRIRGILNAPWIDKSLVDYEYYPPITQAGQVDTFTRINKDFEKLLNSTKLGSCEYDGLILDSMTSTTFALVSQALPLTHAAKSAGDSKGKRIGNLLMPGPEDYGFEAQGIYQILAFLRSLPMKYIIVSAHIVDRYGKRDPADKYSESVVVGEKLSIRDKIGENSLIYFDHVFKFEREDMGRSVRHTCQFNGEIARTAFPNLPNGKVDITGVNFYEKLMQKVNPSVPVLAK